MANEKNFLKNFIGHIYNCPVKCGQKWTANGSNWGPEPDLGEVDINLGYMFLLLVVTGEQICEENGQTSLRKGGQDPIWIHTMELWTSSKFK